VSSKKFNNIKNIIVLGYTPLIEEIIRINNKNNLKTFLITSPDQNKKVNKQIESKVFKNLDTSFRYYIKKNYEIKSTLFISFSARWIFNKSIIKFFKNNLINFHSSRLPFFKGGATFSWQILAEDKIHNQSIHFVNEKVDGGDIILDNTSIFPAWCKIPKDYEDYDYMQLRSFYADFTKKIKNEFNFNITKQSKIFGSYYPRLHAPKDGWVDWNMSSREIYNFINSMDDPYDGARTTYKQIEIKLKNCHIHKGNSIKNKFASGMITKKYEKWVEISCGDSYSLLVSNVLSKDNKNIINKIKSGERFFTPLKKLFDSKSKRTRFGIKGFYKS
jgi:methionyl-tRNA formyltransferase